MIIDKIENLAQYRGISRNFAKAADFALSHNLEEMEAGRYPIDGDQVFVMIQEIETKAEREIPWETHGNYADIQCVLRGAEGMGYANRSSLQPAGEYDPERDIRLYTGAGVVHILHAGEFMAFFPQDGHRPSICPPGCDRQVKKAVFKVRVDW